MASFVADQPAEVLEMIEGFADEYNRYLNVSTVPSVRMTRTLYRTDDGPMVDLSALNPFLGWSAGTAPVAERPRLEAAWRPGPRAHAEPAAQRLRCEHERQLLADQPRRIVDGFPAHHAPHRHRGPEPSHTPRPPEVQQRLSGTDGYAGNQFNVDVLQRMVLNSR